MALTLQESDTTPSCSVAAFCSGRTLTGGTPGDAQASEGATAGTTEDALSIKNGDTNVVLYTYECVIPSGYSDATGPWEVNVDVSTGTPDADITEVHVCRVNSSCVSQESVASSTGLTTALTAGSKQVTPSQGAGVTWASGDIAQVVLVVSQDAGVHGATSVGITPSLTVVAPGSVASVGTTVTPGAGSTVLQGNAPAVDAPETVTVPRGSLTLTGQGPAADAPETVAVPTGSLALTSRAPAVGAPETVSPATATLALTGHTPKAAVSEAEVVAVPSGTLVLRGLTPSVDAPESVAVPTSSLALTARAPSLQESVSGPVEVPATALTLTTFAPTVSTTPTVIGLRKSHLWHVYGGLGAKIEDGTVDLYGHTFKAALLSGSHNPDTENHRTRSDIAGDIIGTDQTVPDATSQSGSLAEWSAGSDMSWDGPVSPRFIAIYDDTAGSKPLLTAFDLGGAQSVPTGATFTMKSGMVFRGYDGLGRRPLPAVGGLAIQGRGVTANAGP